MVGVGLVSMIPAPQGTLGATPRYGCDCSVVCDATSLFSLSLTALLLAEEHHFVAQRLVSPHRRLDGDAPANPALEHIVENLDLGHGHSGDGPDPEATPRKAWLQEQLGDDSAPIVAASDWMTAIPDLVAPWINVPYLVLGTYGFGLSDTREALRDFFSVDSTHIAAAAMVALARSGERAPRDAAAAIKELGIDPELQPVFVLDR
jgi:hypothetical protein